MTDDERRAVELEVRRLFSADGEKHRQFLERLSKFIGGILVVAIAAVSGFILYLYGQSYREASANVKEYMKSDDAVKLMQSEIAARLSDSLDKENIKTRIEEAVKQQAKETIPEAVTKVVPQKIPGLSLTQRDVEKIAETTYSKMTKSLEKAPGAIDASAPTPSVRPRVVLVRRSVFEDRVVPVGRARDIGAECNANEIAVSGGWECRNEDGVCRQVSYLRSATTGDRHWAVKAINGSGTDAVIRVSIVCMQQDVSP